MSLLKVIHEPIINPYFFVACRAYWEQVGS